MKKTVSVGIGGALGTLLRCALFRLPLPAGALSHPLMTLLINATGSFLLGLLTILFVRRIRVSAEMRLAVTAGVMGGYTTFSTMCGDAAMLARTQSALFAAVYLVLTVLLGLSATWGGIRLGKRMEGRRRA